MINYEELEDAALFGIEESLDIELADGEDGWSVGSHGLKDQYEAEGIAEAVYTHYLGYH